MQIRQIRIDCSAAGQTLDHTWSFCVGAGRAGEGLRADWQKQLQKAVRECGFRYIRFHGIFHDDMGVMTMGEDGPHYNFQYIDALFDALLDIGIRPFVELSFMPACIASKDTTLFWWKAHVVPPSDMALWEDLIRHFLGHVIHRYGKKEVESWFFEVWNEPNLNQAFWDGSRSEYFALYKATVKVIKSIDSCLRVGGPATSNFVPDGRFEGETEDVSRQKTFAVDDLDALAWQGVWIHEFLRFCRTENLPVDFVSAHPYPTDFALDGHGVSSGRTRYKDSLCDDISWLQNACREEGYPDMPLYLTEWSSSPTPRDCSHDRLPAAAYILRSNLRNAGKVQALSYWTFTDVFEENGPGPEPFHGGFGMLTLQGVEKPSFHAYRMLNRLGTEKIKEAEGYCFTRAKDGIRAVFYNYPDSCRETVPMSVYPDQSVAEAWEKQGEPAEWNFTLTGLRPSARCRLEILRQESTAVRLWNDMGRPDEMTREEEQKLRDRGAMTEVRHVEADAAGEMRLMVHLKPWEIGCLFPEEPDRRGK